MTREPGSKYTLEKPVFWTSFAKRLAKKQLKNLMASVTEVCKPMVGNITLLSQRLYSALELHTEVSLQITSSQTPMDTSIVGDYW